MHRPLARRPRRVAAAVLTALAACGSDRPVPAAVVVEVAAQPCDRPTRSRGFGVVVDDGIVATAAHTVEGPLRELTVDGAAATIAAIDPRTDLALLAIAGDLDAAPAELSTGTPADATLAVPDGSRRVRIVRTGTLVVHDATDRARHQRQVHTFTPGVAEGTSGAPLLDGDGRVLGVVVLDRRGEDAADAVTAGELARLLDELPATPTTTAPGDCPP